MRAFLKGAAQLCLCLLVIVVMAIPYLTGCVWAVVALPFMAGFEKSEATLREFLERGP